MEGSSVVPREAFPRRAGARPRCRSAGAGAHEAERHADDGRRRAATRTLVPKPGARISSRVDTFGGGAVVVTVKRLTRYPRLVAVVFANGRVITHGGVVPHRGRVSIPLASYVQTIPRGARITLRLAADSGPTDSAYAR